MILVKQGDNIPIHLQLSTGNTGKYVRAQLKDTSGGNIGSAINLTEAGDGLYTDNSQIMPSTQFILCVYKVYDDAGYTTISEDDGDFVDLFVLQTDSSLIRKDTFTAELVSSELTGTIKRGKLTGEMSQESIDGVFYKSPKMVGNIERENQLTLTLCKHCPS